MDIKITDKELLEKLKDNTNPSFQVEEWLKDYFFKESKISKTNFKETRKKIKENPALWEI